MNIFYLDSDPIICAKMHNDKHCVKMILESAQMLSTAHRELDGIREDSKSTDSSDVQDPWLSANEEEESNPYY